MRLLCVLVCLLSICFAGDGLQEETTEGKACGRMLSFEAFQAQAIESGFVGTEEELKSWYEAYMASPVPVALQTVIVAAHTTGDTPPQEKQ